MSKFIRKGKNICAVDCWLDTLGYYRKNVAYDETCLFRSVSEQLFNCQVYHEKVRKECIAYAREHFEEFSHLSTSEEEWQLRLNDLEMHMLYCGHEELEVVSKKYNCDIIIFDASKQEVINITKQNCEKTLLLCLMEEDHYDVVYKKEQISDAGFCQSIAYKILYQNVFGISNVDEIVNNMLYTKQNLLPTDECNKNAEKTDDETVEKNVLETDITGQHWIAPFPFKVAKALDPNIYRNIEYDAWGEVRKELRLGDWYYGDDKLILGTRCIYTDIETQDTFECYIQEIMKDQDQCVVYLTRSAQKRIVSYSDLSPEDNATAWPLPYRFTKSVLIGDTPKCGVPERISYKSKKRFKDKKRTRSESSLTMSGNKLEPIDNVKAYVGVPLQMQNSKSGSSHPRSEVSVDTQTEYLPEIVPLEDVLCGRAAWEPPPYLPSYMPPTPSIDGFMWPPPLSVPPPNHYQLGLKPMIASAPATPDVLPYHDPNITYYYPVDATNYQSYSQWSNSTDISTMSSPVEEKNLEESSKQANEQPDLMPDTTGLEIAPEQATKTSRREKLKILTNLTYQNTLHNTGLSQSPALPQQNPALAHQSPLTTNLISPSPICNTVNLQSPICNNFNPQALMYTNLNAQSPIYTSLTQQSPVIFNMSHQAPICANLSAHSTMCNSLPSTHLNPTMDMYPTMMAFPQVGTPMVYGGPSVAEVSDMMIPTPPVVFTPQMDMQYVSPGPYIYPPTPPASWFSSGVNAHGFVYPRPN